jgi:predicted XRE-type DNA-binding protein
MTKKTYNNIWNAIEPDASIAANLKIRADLMTALIEKIRAQNYSQSKVASILGVHQPRISNLMNGRIDLFSIDELVNMLTALDVDVKLETHNKRLCAA